MPYSSKEQPKIKKKEWYENNKELNLERDVRRREMIRMNVLTYYSPNGIPKCVCCGKTYIPHLTIDHVNNDGTEHRKSIKGKWIYDWIEQNDYPDGFQVMCGDCNTTKYRLGRCGCQD